MESEPKRLAPTKDTLRALFAKSGNQCAFPGCTHPMIDEDDNLIGEVCHIEGAIKGGERFNPEQTNEERRSINNLILLCHRHHVVTDNVNKYSPESLREMKYRHESNVKEVFVSDLIIDAAYDKQLVEIKTLLETHIQETKASFGEQKDMLLVITEQLKQITVPKIEPHDISELHTIKSLRDTNNHRTALTIIQVIKEKKWSQLSDDSRYKVLTNEGICHLELNNYQFGNEAFLEALKLKPNDDHAIAYAAFSAVAVGDKVAALQLIDKCLKVSPKNVNAYNALILLKKDGVYEDVKAEIPVDLLETPEICFNLAIVARSGGYLQEAADLFKVAMEKTKKENPHYLGHYGSTLLEIITNQKFTLLTGQISSEARNQIKDAIIYMTRAWDIYNETEARKNHVWLLANRGIGKKFTNEFEGALEDFRLACQIDPADRYLRRHLTIVLFELGKYSAALDSSNRLLELSTTADEKIEAINFKSDILIKLERFQEAYSLLADLKQDSISDDNMLKYTRRNMLIALIKLMRIPDALEIVETQIRVHPEEPFSLLEFAFVNVQVGNGPKAKEMLTAFYNSISHETTKEDLLEFAKLCSLVNMNDEAIEALEKITDRKIYSELTQNLVRAYFHAGRKKDALDICIELESVYGIDFFLMNLQCAIHESINDPSTSIIVCLRYLDRYPDDQLALIRLALNYDRIGSPQVLEVLAKININDYKLQFDALYRLADIYFKNGNKDRALEIAFETRRAHYNDPNAHLRYFGLLSTLDIKEPEFRFKDVMLNRTVKLSANDGTTIALTILDRSDIYPDRGETNLDDARMDFLLGKNVGDEVVFGRGPFFGRKFMITEVLSKHVHALHESVELLGTRFVGQTNFQVVNLPKSDTAIERIKPLLEFLTQDDIRHSELDEFYRSQKIPVGFYATMTNLSPFKAFITLMNNKEMGIFPGWLGPEIRLVRSQLKEGKSLVIDLTTIATLFFADALEMLDDLTNEILVTQTTFDSISDHLLELRSSPEGFTTLGRMGDEIVRVNVTAHDVSEFRAKIEKLIHWMKRRLTMSSAKSILQISASEKDQLNKTLGAPFIDAILLTRESASILLSEDTVLRQIARNDYEVDSINSFVLSLYLVDIKNRTLTSHDLFAIRLFEMNFKHLPTHPSTMAEAARRSKYSASHLFDLASAGLASPNISEQTAIHYLVTFLYDIYSDSTLLIYSNLPLETIRGNLALMTFSHFFKRSIHLESLIRAIKIKFHLLPEQREEIISLIMNYLTETGQI